MRIKVFEAINMVELERAVNNWLSDHPGMLIIEIRFQMVEKSLNPYAVIILHD